MTTPDAGSILVINAGSSSLKFQLFARTKDLCLLAKGGVTNLGDTPTFHVNHKGFSEEKTLALGCTHEEALSVILNWITTQHAELKLEAVAHRIVHGGTLATQSMRITPQLLEKLWTLSPLAPLHQPHNLNAVERISTLLHGVTQVACFDTAFHSKHTALFTEYALPQKIRSQGIRRYGFHGLSFEWIAHLLRNDEPELAKGRVVTAHLGNGASLCAMHKGISVDTTMGLTALDGLPMGTRSGSLDPGALIYIIRELGLAPEEVEDILYNESGLRGLSDWTNDMQRLQDSDDPKARFAVEFFCLKAAQFIGMMAVSLGGMDALVFTGGIGENSETVRSKILHHLTFLPPFEVRVIPTNEERMMAIHCIALL